MRPYFGALPPGVLRAAGGVTYLKAQGGLKYKVGVSSAVAEGSIAFLGRSRTGHGWILVALRFPVDPSAVYLDKPSHGPEAEGLNGDAVQADNDPAQPPSIFADIATKCPNVRMEWIRNASHFDNFDQPTQIADAINRFIHASKQ